MTRENGAWHTWHQREFVRPTHDLPSTVGYVYHATNEERLVDIAKQGVLTHKPSYGTDQSEWPDGSREKRSYWSVNAAIVADFAPEHGCPVVIRVFAAPGLLFKRERGTGDFYATVKIVPGLIEVLTTNGWEPL